MALSLENKYTFIPGSMGGSTGPVAAALGMTEEDARKINPYMSPLDLYDLLLLEEAPPPLDTPATLRGKKLEPHLRERFESEKGCKVKTFKDSFIHPEHPFIHGTLDGFIEEENTIVEFKTVLTWSSTAKEFGEPLTDQMPMMYLLQGVHYNEVMAHLGVNRVRYGVAFVKDNSGTPESIERFEEYIYERSANLGESLIAKEVYFKNEHALKRVPPSGVRFKKQVEPPSTIVATSRIKQIWDEVNELKAKIYPLDNELDTKINELKAYMSEFESLKDEQGNELATLKIRTVNRKPTEGGVSTYPMFQLRGIDG